MLRLTLAKLSFIVSIALVLTACGGGGGADDSDANNGPPNNSTSYTVGGTVTGLSGSIVLLLNGTNNLTVDKSGAFAFNTPLQDKANYAVVIANQPANQVCSVTAGGAGTINAANVNNVSIACTAFSVSGTISGLTKSGLVLQLNETNDLAVAASSTAFSFPSSASLGALPFYVVHIKSQPTGQTCTIVSAAGILSSVAPSVSNVALACVDNVTDPLSGTYQITSASGQSVTVRGFLTLYPDGTYLFGLHSDDTDCTTNNGNGIEYGVYRWNRNTGAFAIVNAVIDTNGDCGIVDPNEALPTGTLAQLPDGVLKSDVLDSNGSGAHVQAVWSPVTSTPNTLVGSWGDNQSFAVLSGDGKLFFATTKALAQNQASTPGVEDGCFTFTGTTTAGTFSAFDFGASCSVSAALKAVDANGPPGFSGIRAAVAFTVTADAMSSAIGPLTPFPFTGSAARIAPTPYQPPTGFSISATITGLTASGLALQNNGGVGIGVPSGATTATVAMGILSGASYAVTVQSQPTGQFCSVTNGFGVASGNVGNVAVNCVTITSATYAVGGTISGLTGAGLKLRLNGQTDAAHNVTVTGTSFAFGAALRTGDAYSITIVAQPSAPTQICFPTTNQSGTINGGDIAATISCFNSAPYKVSGAVTGLNAAGLTLHMGYVDTYTGAASSAGDLNLAANATAFNFADTIPANGYFQIDIAAQPTGQTCMIAKGRGVSLADFDNVGIACMSNSTDQLSGAYTFFNADGRQYINFNADGTYTTALIHNSSDCDNTTDTRHGNGVEYGAYNWNSTTNEAHTFSSNAIDTNGTCGLNNPDDPADNVGYIVKAGDTLEFRDTPTGAAKVVLTPVESQPSTLIGAFVPQRNNGTLLVFHADGTYLFVETQLAGLFPLGYGQERGCYSASGSALTMTIAASCRPDGFAAYDLNAMGGYVNAAAGVKSASCPFAINDAETITVCGAVFKRTHPN